MQASVAEALQSNQAVKEAVKVGNGNIENSLQEISRAVWDVSHRVRLLEESGGGQNSSGVPKSVETSLTRIEQVVLLFNIICFKFAT